MRFLTNRGLELYSASSVFHPGQKWQVSLSQQLRDCQNAMDKAVTIFAPVMLQFAQQATPIQNLGERSRIINPANAIGLISF